MGDRVNRHVVRWVPAIVALLAALGLFALGSGQSGFTELQQASTAMGDTVPAKAVMVTTPVDEVRRGDIVVFKGTAWHRDDAMFVMRVVALGGDTVSCCDGDSRLSVNGRVIVEDYVRDGDIGNGDPYDVTVPNGHMFVLGDSRANSYGSRREELGPVPLTDVVSRVVGVKTATGVEPIAVATAFRDRGFEVSEPAGFGRPFPVAPAVLLGVAVVWLAGSFLGRRTGPRRRG
ncbi:MAG: signal peptidase I [Saccharothrix sp.]|nr:signal peptidase I [Saccharothrix sp.]